MVAVPQVDKGQAGDSFGEVVGDKILSEHKYSDTR